MTARSLNGTASYENFLSQETLLNTDWKFHSVGILRHYRPTWLEENKGARKWVILRENIIYIVGSFIRVFQEDTAYVNGKARKPL